MDERGETRSEASSETRGEASSATLDIFTIAAGGRRIGVDSAEIERVVSGKEALGREEGLIGDFRARGRYYRLEELLPGGRAEDGHPSAFVLKSDGGRNGLVAFDGVMDVMKIAIANIMPVPEFIRRVQKPLFVWGFYASEEGPIMLLTFHYLAREGST